MQDNVVLQVCLLEEGSLTYLTLELLLAGVLLHMPCHVLCGDRLSTDVALSTLLALARVDFRVSTLSLHPQNNLVLLLPVRSLCCLNDLGKVLNNFPFPGVFVSSSTL